MEKIEKYMKQALKNKVKITKAAIIAILITGGIAVPKIARADTPNEKAVDIFKDLKLTNKTDELQSLVDKEQIFKNKEGEDNLKPDLDKIVKIAKDLINYSKQAPKYIDDGTDKDGSNLQYKKNEIYKIQAKLLKYEKEREELNRQYEKDYIENVHSSEGLYIYSPQGGIYNYIEDLVYACNNVITQRLLDKHTYKNQMDRLAKIVDRNSEKSGTVNEHYYQYYITNENEKHGLELGDNSQARGTGSIVTSENGIAFGKGAVATGGDNVSREDIERKLKENQEKLNEIENLKKTNATLTNQLSDLQQKEQDVIQAGIRVEQIRKAKADAEKEASRLKNAWQTEVDGSKEFFKNYQAKIDDLNSRLTGVGKLKNNNIQTPEGLEKAVDEFKHNVEDGTNLNLSRDFYKDYITSYYKALGDLRENNAINSCIGSGKVLPNGKENSIKNIIDANFLKRDLKDIVIQYSYYSSDSFSSSDSSSSHGNKRSIISASSSYSSHSSSDGSSSSATAAPYNSLGEYSIDRNGIGKITGLRHGGYQKYNDKLIKTYKDIDTDLTDQTDYDLWKSVKDGWKAQIHDANKRSGSEFFGKFDTLTNGKSTILFNMVTDMKFELVDLDYEITYAQWKYEQTHDTTWLDKKKEYINKRQEKLDTNEKIIKDKYKELFGDELRDTYYTFSIIGEKIENDWKKENITDVENKNKITIEKLTSELEKALGVNKNVIKERQEKLDRMKSEYEQAERNAKGLNPSEKDLILSKEYERVKAEIEQMTNTLKTNQERLKALKDALTLYDLKNKGKDNIAYGTDTLAVGNNAIAFGKGTKTVGENSISFGVDLLTTGNNNTNVGQLSQVNGEKNQVMGFSNEVKGDQNLVIGNNNRVISNGQVSSIAKVTFIDRNNKDHIMYVPKHTAIKEVPNPSLPDKGYFFKDWNLDRKGTGTSVTKDTIVIGDMTVYQINDKMSPMIWDNIHPMSGKRKKTMKTLLSTPTLDLKDREIKVGEKLDLNSLVFSAHDDTDGDLKNQVKVISVINTQDGVTYEVKNKYGATIHKQNTITVTTTPTKTYNVTFVSDDGNKETVTVNDGDSLESTHLLGKYSSYNKPGYVFWEFSTDKHGNTEITTKTPIHQDTKVYTIWKPIPTELSYNSESYSNISYKYNINQEGVPYSKKLDELLPETTRAKNGDKVNPVLPRMTEFTDNGYKYTFVGYTSKEGIVNGNYVFVGQWVAKKINPTDSPEILEPRLDINKVRTRRSVGANPSESTPKVTTPIVNENVLQGNRNEIFGNGNLVFGSENKVGTETKGVMNNILFGNKIDATNVNNAIVFGNESKPIEGAVSFGNDTTTRQLKFVSKGIDDTDAVNFSQLKDYVKKHSKGSNIKGEIISEFNNTPDTYLKIDENYLKYISDKQVSPKIPATKTLSLNMDGIKDSLGKDSNITNPINKFVTDTQVHDYVTTNFVSKDDLDVTKFLKSSDLDVTGDDTYITVTPNTDKTKKTYKVAFNDAKLTNTINDSDFSKNKSIQDMLDKKANKDASNITNLTSWQAILGNGKVDKGNEGLVTGQTVYNYINPINLKVDQLSTSLNDKLSDITINGDTYIKTEKINNSSYNLSLNKDSLETLINSKIVNLAKNDTITNINTELGKKANKNASNLKEQDIKDWQIKLGTGKVDKDNKGLVTGNTVYEVKEELNKKITTNTENITKLNNKYTTLNNQVTTNTSDIKTLKTDVEGLKKTTQDITNINTKLGNIDNSITNINTKLDGKLDKSDLSIKGDNYIKVDKDTKFNYTLSLNKTKLANDLDLTNNSSINNMFTTKLGNINTNIGELKTKVKTNTNNINSLTTKVTDNTNKITNLTNKVDTNTKDIDTLKQDMTKKLNVDANNLTTKGETNLINKLSKGSDISKPNNKLVTDTQVNTFLNDKFKNFSTNIDNRVINTLQQGVNVVNNKADLALAKSDLALTGISNAVAMANLPQVASYGKYKHMLTAAYGNYAGVNALALGFSGTTDSRRITYKISGSVNTKGNLAFGTGIGVMLGEIHDSNVDTPSHVKEQLIKSEKERQLMRKTLINQQNKAKQQENQIKDLYRIIGELQNQLKNNEKTKESIEKH
ncbi:YadA-like family protein [uncultured Sneathia sp.]|uniref:YadA-like family protein n=1 Tax=uncultured Sneathia sp. TaxID=278067 RepID=UPI00259B4D64|nr:YadA-like family protein [uncultured Sneathia sp.]